MDVDAKTSGMLGGQDIGSIIDIVKGGLNGSTPEQLVQLSNSKK